MADPHEEFLRLFAANQRRIYGFIATLVPRASDADDVFQEVSVSLWRKFHEFEKGTDFAAWGIQFARYLVLKHFEKQKRLKRLVFDNDILVMIADEAAVETEKSDDRLDALRGCLEKLPHHSRQLLKLRYNSELKTCRNVATQVGRSVDATYKALSRIHISLLRCIEHKLLLEEGR